VASVAASQSAANAVPPPAAATSVASAAAKPLQAQPQGHRHLVLFDGGERSMEGVKYQSFRIPSLVSTPNGALVAFAEGRVHNSADHGDIDLVYKRSTDGGRTWSRLRSVVRVGRGTWGNPTAVVDRRNGRIWLFMSWNAPDKSLLGAGATKPVNRWGDRRVYLSSSSDAGRTWSSPRDMTKALLPRGHTWDAMGPGVGIQTRSGRKPGRLVVPALGRNIFSDDGGRTWRDKRIPGGTSEGAIVEMEDGTLVRNDRPIGPTWRRAQRRWVSRGSIEEGFSRFQPDYTPVDSRVQGSVFRFPGHRSRILFLNPASTTQRCRMTLRISYDDGHTWPIARALHDGPRVPSSCELDKGGYSSLTAISTTTVGALVEIGDTKGGMTRRSVEFHAVNLPWLLQGRPEPAPQGVPKRRLVRLGECPKDVAAEGGTPGKCVAGRRDAGKAVTSSTTSERWAGFRNGWPSALRLGSWLDGARRSGS
jgi:sialidase-1